MRKKERSEILIVPPGGSRIRTIRLRAGLLLFLLLVIVGGFAGYFIPFNNFTIDVVEQNRQKNLEDQNNKLLSAIRPMRKLLDNLNDEVQKLEGKRKGIVEKLGMKDSPPPRVHAKSKTTLTDLLYRINREEAFFRSYYTFITNHPACFDSLPLVKPIQDNPVMGARFDKVKDPFTQTMKGHYGVDFIAARGTPVLSSASGTVAKIEESKVWGKRITINHAFGFSTVYAHLGTVDAFTGKKVKKGDCIGTVGISGITSGPHVHFELWYQAQPVNPEDLFFPSVDSVLNTALR